MPSLEEATALRPVVEGTTELLVPPSEHRKGPKRKEGVPFYNPAMRLSRDLSVLVLAQIRRQAARDITVCDAMASLGARGLRFANEVEGVQVLLNDANPDAIMLARQNAERIGLRNVDFRLGRLESLLADDRWDWVDIDPFGTPAPYLDLAVDSVKDGGILAVTATDKAALSGVYPDVCLRRYNARPLRAPILEELATRILLGAIARAAGRRDRSIECLLAHSTEHYVRVYARVLDGARAADEQARGQAYAWMAPDLRRGLSLEPPPGTPGAGPLWAGALGDLALLQRLESPRRDVQKLLNLLREDAGSPPLYYTIDEFTRSTKVNAPKLDHLLERLRQSGHCATRTHFTPRGFKTDASPDSIRRALHP